MSEQPTELFQTVPVEQAVQEEVAHAPAFFSASSMNHDGEVVEEPTQVQPTPAQPQIAPTPVATQPAQPTQPVQPTAVPTPAAQPVTTTDDPAVRELANELGLTQSEETREERVEVPAAVRLNIQQDEYEQPKTEAEQLDEILIGQLPTIDVNHAEAVKPAAAPVAPQAETEQVSTKEGSEDPLRSIHRRLSRLEASTEYWKYNAKDDAVKPSSQPVRYTADTFPYRDARRLDIEDKGFQREADHMLMLPADRRENLMHFMEQNPDEFDGKDADAKLVSMTTGFYLSEKPREFQDGAINDPGANMQLGYEVVPGKVQRSRRMSMQPREGKATGVVARALIMDAIGMSTPFQVILPHSGLVATIATPTAAELLDFQSTIDNSKVRIGRILGGSNYGQQTWFLHSQIVNLFLKKVMKINLRNVTNTEDIRELISPLDLPTIAWALACSKYPDGYAYNRTVLQKDGTATPVIGTIDLQDLEIVLNSRFSRRQLNFLDAACGQTLSTEEEIRAYQNDWKEESANTVRVLVSERRARVKDQPVTKKVYLELAEGNVVNFFRHGSAWDGYLADAINQVMASGANENQKQSFLADKIEATELRDYSHFIKAVEVETIYEDGKSVSSRAEDNDAILEFLDLAGNAVAMYESTDTSIRASIVKAIREFIDNRVRVVYGTPTYSELEDERFASGFLDSEIVPIDPVSVFFITTARTYRSLADSTA